MKAVIAAVAKLLASLTDWIKHHKPELIGDADAQSRRPARPRERH